MSTKHEEVLERLKAKAAEDEGQESNGGSNASPPSPEPEAAEEKKSSIREYIIITGWKEVGVVEAGSAKAALESLGKGDGEFGVIPARNFSNFSVKTETTTVTHVTPA